MTTLDHITSTWHSDLNLLNDARKFDFHDEITWRVGLLPKATIPHIEHLFGLVVKHYINLI